jgi:hypothetical protein
MRLFLQYFAMFFFVLAVFGCGVGWLPRLSDKELLQYKNVVSLSKDRYANFRSSFGLSKFYSKKINGINICSFQIATNNIRQSNSRSVFIGDMKSYCEINNGIFENLLGKKSNLFKSKILNKNKELNIFRSRIIKKYTSETTVNIRPIFECGPKGRGTISDDWTKFNPEVCRKLPDTKKTKIVNWQKVNKEVEEYKKKHNISDNLPSFICMKEKGVLFIGTISKQSDGNVVIYNVRLNQKENSLIKFNDALNMK